MTCRTPYFRSGGAAELLSTGRLAIFLQVQGKPNSVRFGPVAYPAFDVTLPRHIDAIATEHGQFPPESVVVPGAAFGDEVEVPGPGADENDFAGRPIRVRQ